MEQNRVQTCIELLCQKGCTSVLETIRALEEKRTVEEATNLSHDEIQTVLTELRNIMAVYRE